MNLNDKMNNTDTHLEDNIASQDTDVLTRKVLIRSTSILILQALDLIQ